MQSLREIRVGALRFALEGLERVSRLGRPGPDIPQHLLIGLEGEKEAYFYLTRKGYQVVATRWSAGNVAGDIDIVAWKGELLCIIEVKTRTAHDMTPAEVAVDSHKRAILRRLAQRYVRQLPQPINEQPVLPQVRFDVISVYLIPREFPEVVHFEKCIWMERAPARIGPVPVGHLLTQAT